MELLYTTVLDGDEDEQSNNVRQEFLPVDDTHSAGIYRSPSRPGFWLGFLQEALAGIPVGPSHLHRAQCAKPPSRFQARNSLTRSPRPSGRRSLQEPSTGCCVSRAPRHLAVESTTHSFHRRGTLAAARANSRCILRLRNSRTVRRDVHSKAHPNAAHARWLRQPFFIGMYSVCTPTGGWDAFDKCYYDGDKCHVGVRPDGGSIEIICNGCGSHLGHVFMGEHQTPTDERH